MQNFIRTQTARQWLWLVAWLSCQLAYGQQMVTGTVTDGESRQPLPGVTVLLKNTTQGTTTGSDGKFRLAVPGPNATLVFSFVGYDSQETTASTTPLEVVMQSSQQSLNEVVVVGYGSATKKELTGSIVNVSPKEFNKGNVNALSSLLQGKVAGLTISKQGSDPTRSASVLLRGPSTLAGSTEPFYVIDGVPGADIGTIAPEDIVAVDVLKDAASTAIYGTRAANGVIIVTTKRGKAGVGTLSYNTFYSIENISKRLDVATGDELRAYLKSVNRTLSSVDDDGANTDWQREITRQGSSRNHHLSFGGGTAETRYQVSFGYYGQTGVVEKSDFKRYTGRINLDHSMFKNRLRLALNIGSVFANGNNINYDALFQATTYLPTVNVFNPDGTYKENYGRQVYYNPVALIDQQTNKYKNMSLTSNARAVVDLLPGLTYTLSGSYEFRNRETDIYQNRNSFQARNTNGYASRGLYNGGSKILETYANYDKVFGVHDLKLLAGYSYQYDFNNDGIQAQNNNFLLDDLAYYGIGLGSPVAGYNQLGNLATLTDNKLISFYSRVNYGYKGKYLLNASLRRDGSSRFGDNNKWAMFPAASVAWRLSEESFLKSIPTINDLKLRVGYGVSGFQAIPPYGSLQGYRASSKAYYNGAYINAFGLARLANPDLKWEKTATANIGLDFALFKGRLSGSVDVYDKTTTDMIYTYSLPVPPFPVSEIQANGGEMNNKGVEVVLNYDVINKTGFTWTTGLNYATNRNKIVSLSQGIYAKQYEYSGNVGGRGFSFIGTQIIQPGYSVGTFNLFPYAGQDPTTHQFLYTNSLGETVTVSKLVTPRDQQIITSGNALPKFTFGWTNTLTYNKFTLNFLLRGVYGNKILNGQATNLARLAEATAYNSSADAVLRGNPDAPMYSTYFLEDGSYLRLDNATLSYALPRTPVFKNASVYVTGQNLFTITKFTGADPEVNLSGKQPGIVGINANGLEPIYFKTRSLTAGLNINF